VLASEFDAEVRTSEFDATEVSVSWFTRRGRVCDPTGTVKPNRTGKSKAEMVNFLITLMPPLNGWLIGNVNCSGEGWSMHQLS